MDIEKTIVRHVQSLTKSKKTRVNAQTSLIAKGLLDSLDILDLIEFVERTFDVKLTDEDMNPDCFETAGQVAELVRAKLAKK